MKKQYGSQSSVRLTVKNKRFISLGVIITAGLLLVTTFVKTTRPAVDNRDLPIPIWPSKDGESTGDRADVGHSNVFFLKVHKCASSTVQNILMRYGHREQLNFVLPETFNYLGHPQPFLPSMALPIKDGQEYNIFCHHSRFNKMGVREILPQNAVYVAILRDPAHLFESIFSYYDLKDFYGMGLEAFVDMPSWWLKTLNRKNDRIGINQIAFDFGIDEKDFSDKSKIKSYIDNLTNTFDLVLIAEYFEESIILLKHLLNLELQDVIYIALNERAHARKMNVTQQMADKLRHVNHVDQQIYDHFLERFQQKVKEFGEAQMAAEVAELSRLNAHWTQFCGFRKVSNQISNADPMFVPYESYKLQTIELESAAKTQSVCKYLVLPEIQFTYELKRIHIVNHGSIWQRILYALGLYQ